jgi:hypothetical protein
MITVDFSTAEFDARERVEGMVRTQKKRITKQRGGWVRFLNYGHVSDMHLYVKSREKGASGVLNTW